MNEKSKGMQALFDLKWLEDHSYLNTPFHKLHAVIKIVIALLFVVKVAATPVNQVFVLTKLLLLLGVSMYVSKINLKEITKRTIPGLVLVTFFGIGYFFSYPWEKALIMLLGIVIKAYLSIGFVLVVVATTGIDSITQGLMWLRIPRLVLLQLQLTYRYLGRFMDRVTAMSLSYKMRSQGKGIEKEAWGSFLGHLFLGAMNDAHMVQQSMALRGYHMKSHLHKESGPSWTQWIGVMIFVAIIFID